MEISKYFIADQLVFPQGHCTMLPVVVDDGLKDRAFSIECFVENVGFFDEIMRRERKRRKAVLYAVTHGCEVRFKASALATDCSMSHGYVSCRTPRQAKLFMSKGFVPEYEIHKL